MTLMTSVNKKWKLVPAEDIFLDGNIFIFFNAKKNKKKFCGNSNKYFGTAVSETQNYVVNGTHVPGQPKFVAKNALGPQVSPESLVRKCIRSTVTLRSPKLKTGYRSENQF